MPDALEDAQIIIAHAIEQWPGCRGDVVYDPFIGLAVAAPGFYDSNEERYRQSIEVAGQLEKELPEWSRQFPKFQFVFIRWEWWGWEVDWRGYVCQDGTISQRYVGETAFHELVAVLGVTLGPRNYFPPLSHSFYW